MKKLSNAQQKVMDKAYKDIDEARTMEFETWFEKQMSWCQPDHREKYRERYMKICEEQKNGIVLTTCNSRTLKKLEEYGLIEIIEDSNGQAFGIDVIKVLNY